METGYKVTEHKERSVLNCFHMKKSGGKDIPDSSFSFYQTYRAFSCGRAGLGGDGFSGPTEEELYQVKAERKKKWKREAEYSRLLEESSLKRRYKEKIKVRRNPHGSLTTRSYAERKEDGRTGTEAGKSENTENRVDIQSDSETAGSGGCAV